jgi:DNA-binding MarR family transcriptional regulator
MTTSIDKPLLKLPPRPPRELLKSTGFLLKRLGFSIKEKTVEAFEAQGANPYQHGVLCKLAESQAETQAQIADALGYDRSHLVGVLDSLEERGLIERRRDPVDRRRHLVTLTPAGEKALARVRKVVKQVNDSFLEPLDAAERKTLTALLARLAAHHDPRYRANGGS